MTQKTLDWLNQNRFRAFPLVNDEGLVADGIRIPVGFILDCQVMDMRQIDRIPKLVFTGLVITDGNYTVSFEYDGTTGSCTVEDGEFGYVRKNALLLDGQVHSTFVFSSHKWLLEHVGTGTWSFTGQVFPTRIVTVRGSGVSGIQTNGSHNVQSGGIATGDVHLTDGYRTQPVVDGGRVLVKVGTKYGLDPCHLPSDGIQQTPCDDLLLYFCGQDARATGNVIIGGGSGVDVRNGIYEAKCDIPDSEGNVGIAAGEKVPCVEICATRELLNIYRPSEIQSE